MACFFFVFVFSQKVKEEETVLNKILFLYMHSYPGSPLGKLQSFLIPLRVGEL